MPPPNLSNTWIVRQGGSSLGEPVGRFHTWWRGDPLPKLP